MAEDGIGVALQSKSAQQFVAAKFTDAVDAFRKTKPPFNVSRFILGGGREIRQAQTIDLFKTLQNELIEEPQPVKFELWDKREPSQKLKHAPSCSDRILQQRRRPNILRVVHNRSPRRAEPSRAAT